MLAGKFCELKFLKLAKIEKHCHKSTIQKKSPIRWSPTSTFPPSAFTLYILKYIYIYSQFPMHKESESDLELNDILKAKSSF